ncbi:MAG TPA: aminoglycoside phosphotransferase family protein [Rubrobacter sp.]|nr:aminoglycoside phosphotransferase family protein [Rubrobacter sp.]
MTVRTPVNKEEPIPNEVEEVLARGLQNHFERPVRILELHSTFLADTFSTHPMYRLHLTLDSGQRLTLIFKWLQPQQDEDIRREVLIYRRLLADGHFDAPAVYASLCDEARGRYWLFFEDVGGLRLEWCDVDDWPAAFRWAARMHAGYYGREGELMALGCLGEHGRPFYRFLARGAREMLEWLDARRRLVRFERLMARWFDLSVEHLARRPRTLLHGDLDCHNLMVQSGPKIRPIDWGYAAIGVAGWDVAKLIAGWGPEKSHFIGVYLDEFALHAPGLLDRRAFERTLAHCQIMRTLQILYWWEGPYKNLAFVDGVLEEMESACRNLDSAGSDG